MVLNEHSCILLLYLLNMYPSLFCMSVMLGETTQPVELQNDTAKYSLKKVSGLL